MAALRNVSAFKGFQWSTILSYHSRVMARWPLLKSRYRLWNYGAEMTYYDSTSTWGGVQHHHKDSRLRPYHQPKIFIEIILSCMMPTRWKFRNPFTFQHGTPQHRTMCDLQTLRWASMFRGRFGDFCPSCGKSCQVELDENENPSFRPCGKDLQWTNPRVVFFWGS